MTETFLEMLIDCKNRGAKAEMILDLNGLERAEGIIQEIHRDVPNPYIALNDGRIIEENTIIALNGVFRAAYAGC
ncbi:hypothetical protein CLV98_1165 [Dyadobacter jejuensis]|uniref:Uncharacterized protein n=2 Tax=Dyadobacter jejuensis TaxID=1082580 RepID=A0A316AAS0_9BACT|nr:hypothetical protein CLV98_1165 [Dyadobacter jejuensis]